MINIDELKKLSAPQLKKFMKQSLIKPDELELIKKELAMRSGKESKISEQTITKGMARTLRGSRKCAGCGMEIPKYPGRYPKNCPECGTELTPPIPMIERIFNGESVRDVVSETGTSFKIGDTLIYKNDKVKLLKKLTGGLLLVEMPDGEEKEVSLAQVRTEVKKFIYTIIFPEGKEIVLGLFKDDKAADRFVNNKWPSDWVGLTSGALKQRISLQGDPLKFGAVWKG